jgi:hypothetical protein
MARKVSLRPAHSNPPVPVVLFGVDDTGKPKAARFGEKQADLATKAAGPLNLQVLPVIGPAIVDLAGRVPAGRIHANGRGFVPYIRRDLYAKLVAATGGPSAGDQAPTEVAATSNSSAGSGSQQDGALPKSWDEISAGHAVIAQDEPSEGWYEAVVIETNGEMLVLRWRDYPRERRFSRHRLSIGLMYPHGLPALEDNPTPLSQSTKTKTGPKQSGDEAKTVYPATWDAIDLDCLVLAKEDGPWRTWWEAIPIAKSDHMFLVRWRDFPKVPDITRPRWTLGLLYPNGR